MELSINPNTIQRAYGELERNGFIYTVKGRGSFVGSVRKLRTARQQEVARKMEDLAREARKIGISKEEFIETASAVYDYDLSGAEKSGRELKENGGNGREKQRGEEDEK